MEDCERREHWSGWGIKTLVQCRQCSLAGMKRKLRAGVLVQVVRYKANSLGIRMDVIRKLCVMEIKCIRSICGVIRLHRWMNDDDVWRLYLFFFVLFQAQILIYIIILCKYLT